MAKLVDAHDSGSCGEILGGSTPPIDKFNAIFYIKMPQILDIAAFLYYNITFISQNSF